MGTSSKWLGPPGGAWRRATAGLTRSLNQLDKGPANNGRTRGGTISPEVPIVLDDGLPPDKVAHHGQAFFDALRTELRADPESFGLRRVAQETGLRLVDVLASLEQHGVDVLGPFDRVAVHERMDVFVERFTDRVAGSRGLIVDSVVRGAVVRSVERLLQQSQTLRHAVRTGHGGAGGISDELFCDSYRTFFAGVVTGFLESVIAGKVKLMFPVLPVVDPAADIADWIAEKVTALIPTPCQEKQERNANDTGASVADLGRSLTEETIERALGIPVHEAS